MSEPFDRERLKELFHLLVEAYTPSGKEEEGVAVLVKRFKKAGIPFRLQRVEEERENLIVLPQSERPSLLFLGHLDTVVAPDWEEFEWKEKDGRIEGLGTADMKGGCAAMAEAYISLWEAGLRDLPVTLAFVVGEEEDGDGTEKLLQEWRFPLALVAEPTNLRPCFSHYGYMEAKVTTEGERVHASVAPLGVNPIAEMLRLLLEIISAFKDRKEGIIYNFRDLMSSPSGFAVPEWCEVWIDLHLPPLVAPAPLIYDLEELLRRQREKRSRLKAHLSFTTVHEGYDLPLRGLFYDFFQKAFEKEGLPFEPDSFRSHSDANLLWREGTRSVLIGPGRLEEAHRRGEGVEWRDVQAATALFRTLMLQSADLLEGSVPFG